jgi:hypothetical protein
LIKTATDPSKIDDNNPRVATKYILSQNYPNPFNPTTTIRFSLPKASFITLKVYNPLGQQVATLIKGQVLAGEHQIKWHAKNLPSGIYIYQLQAGDFVQNKKMILLK